jgi:hypothetical protein
MPRIFKSGPLLGIFEFGEDFIGCYALEGWGEEFLPLLGVAVGSVEGVAGLDLSLLTLIWS